MEYTGHSWGHRGTSNLHIVLKLSFDSATRIRDIHVRIVPPLRLGSRERMKNSSVRNLEREGSSVEAPLGRRVYRTGFQGLVDGEDKCCWPT